MASFLNSAQKTSIEKCFDDLHDTFKRDIYIFIEEGPDIPASIDYNPLYGRTPITPKDPSQRVEVKYTRQARIYHMGNAIEKSSDTSLHIPSSEGKVRLKVNSETLELLKKSSKVEIDDDLWVVIGDASPEGPFSRNYFFVYCRRMD